MDAINLSVWCAVVVALAIPIQILLATVASSAAAAVAATSAVCCFNFNL